ncbi:MAG: cell division protein [Gammaproteobacteria bacterium]|nr:MAG: cell division protein [Gammaproteobacteria bacterium]
MPRHKVETGTPSQPRRSGAVESRRNLLSIVRAYFHNHRKNASESFERMVAEPLQSVMTMLVVAIALALPAMLYVGVSSLQQLSGSWDSSAQMTLFLKKGAKDKAVKSLIKRLEANSDLAEVHYISPNQALDALQDSAGFGEALNLLDENPLPPVLLVVPIAAIEADVPRVEQLVKTLAKHPLVDEVQLDMKWLQRMQQILDIGRQITVLLGGALSLGVLLVVGNTIRLAIENRREEILVVKLVGGTNSFVRRPFLYTGLWYGIFGGLIAWLGVVIAQFWLGATVSRLAALYQSDFALKNIGLEGMLVLIALGGILGLVGAALAVGRHIAQLEP